MSLTRDPAKAREWADRSAERAKARARTTKRKGVNPQSARRKADAVERRALVARLLAETPRCPARIVCRGARTTDVHERLTRARGGSITDERHGHMVALCRGCHAYITDHTGWADLTRWTLPSWHQCPPVGPC